MSCHITPREHQEGQVISENELVPVKVCTSFMSIFLRAFFFYLLTFYVLFHGCSPVLLELVCDTVNKSKDKSICSLSHLIVALLMCRCLCQQYPRRNWDFKRSRRGKHRNQWDAGYFCCNLLSLCFCMGPPPTEKGCWSVMAEICQKSEQ